MVTFLFCDFLSVLQKSLYMAVDEGILWYFH